MCAGLVFKKLLLLPKSTPDCLVRLETGSMKLSYDIFKMSLGWLGKLLAMPDNRLPRICFLRLLSLDIPDSRYSWITQLKSIFNGFHGAEFWDNPTLGSYRLSKDRLLDRYRQMIISGETASYNSLRYPLFQNCFTSDRSPQPYLLYNVHIKYCRILAQLRLCYKKQLRIFHNGCLCLIDFAEVCSICNLNKNESLLHLFTECPHYKCVRTPAVLRCKTFEDIQTLLNNLSSSDFKDVFLFMDQALKLRAFFRNE